MTPLEKSILHWRENVAATRPSQAATDAEHCALCTEHWSGANPGPHVCSGCPVAEFTGKSGCEGSPWSRTQTALTNWEVNPHLPEAAERYTTAAQDELDFLISLLPEKDTPA